MKAKKLIAVLIAALILAGTLPAMAANENSINDTFDTYNASAKEGDWGGNGVLASVGKGKSVVIGNGNGDLLNKSIEGFSENVTGFIANFSIKFENATNKEVIFGVGTNNGVAGTSRMLQFTGSGKMQALASGDFNIPIAYTTDVWYDVTVMVNYNTGYYFVSVNDGIDVKSHTFTNDKFKRDSAAKANIGYYSFWISDANADEKVYVDNVNIFGTTDDRIYPHVEKSFTFESFLGADGTTVPDGFTSDSTLSAANGFFGDGTGLKLVSGTENELGIVKTLDTAIKPANVQIKLGDAVKGNFSISISDSSGKSESINVENIAAGELISLTVKGGKLMRVFAGDDTLYGSADTALTDVKEIEILSPAECESDFEIESIKMQSCTFSELVSTLGDVVKPDTNEITLTFSNEILESSEEFVLIGDREIENITFSGKSVKLTLDDKLSPDSDYTLKYTNLLDKEGNLLTDTVKFKTDIAIMVNEFKVESDALEHTLTANLVSNTGVNNNAVIILASFDKTSGMMNTTTDIKNIEITSLADPKTLKIAKTDNETVEAYIWESFYSLKSAIATAKDAGKITIKAADFDDDMYLTLSGKTEKGSEGDKVLLQIYDNDTNLENLKTIATKADLVQNLDYIREIELDEKGEFSLKVLLSGASKGYKNIRISAGSSATEFKNAFLCATSGDVNAFLTKVNETGTANTAFSNYINTMLDFIEEEDGKYSESDKKVKICNELISLRKSIYGGSFTDIEDVKKAFNMAMLSVDIAAGGNVENAISEYGSKSSLADESFFDYYGEHKADVIAQINQNLPATSDELFANKLFNVIGKALILSEIKNVSSYTKIPEILNDNAVFLGYDLKDYNSLSDTSSVDKELVGFEGTVEELFEAISTLVGKDPDPQPTQKPSIVGGGGTAVFGDDKKEDEIIEYFNDLSGVMWAKESINALAKLGIVNGIGKGEYEPHRNVTREEFVKMAVEAFYRADKEGEQIFSDITEKDWSYAYVSTAYKKGFVKGINSEEFGKGMSISREDAAVILSRIYGKNAEMSLRYADSSDISDYALSGVKTLTSLKVFTGDENGCFLPKKTLTRAECAKVIYTLYTILTGGK